MSKTNGHPTCLRIALVFFVLTFGLCICAVSAEEVKPAPKLFTVTTAAYAGFAVADWAASSKCIQHTATCSEQNPLYRGVSQSPVAFALAKGAMTSGTIYAVWKLRQQHPRAAWIVLGGLTGLQAYVVEHNLKVIR